LTTTGADGASDTIKPVGVPTRRAQVSMNYNIPAFQAVSLDVGLNYAGGTAFSLFAGPVDDEVSLDAGLRIEFGLWSARWFFRFQMTNVTDEFTWLVDTNGGLTYSFPRAFNLALTGRWSSD
jgi:hypothetical protein